MKSRNMSLGPNHLEAYLKQSAEDLGDPGRDDWFGEGRINAKNALDLVDAGKEGDDTLPPDVTIFFPGDADW